jgi:hypothetical protein
VEFVFLLPLSLDSDCCSRSSRRVDVEVVLGDVTLTGAGMGGAVFIEELLPPAPAIKGSNPKAEPIAPTSGLLKNSPAIKAP